ncbi:MAG: hypothetical protein HYU64_16205, partial [Armatimonadetes bacterium]|nr:hypothetical protein [Armatimonadota bacterium]
MSLKRRDFLALGTAAGAFLAINKDPFEFLFRPPRHYMERAQERLGSPAAIRKAIPSTCMQCYSSCGIVCYIEDGRLVKIEGNPQHPHNRGKVCAKGLSGLNKV